MKFKNISIYQHWAAAYDDWYATQAEKRSFKQQMLLIQNQDIDTSKHRSIDSYFCQIKTGNRPISQEADRFGNDFFGINRKNL